MRAISLLISVVLISCLVYFCFKQVKGLINVIKKRKQDKLLNNENENKGGEN